MSGDKPKEWCIWLPLVEWWYNTHFHTATQMTRYKIIYNEPPSLHLPYLAGDSRNDTIDRSLQKREAMIQLLKFHLTRAQVRMKN